MLRSLLFAGYNMFKRYIRNIKNIVYTFFYPRENTVSEDFEFVIFDVENPRT